MNNILQFVRKRPLLSFILLLVAIKEILMVYFGIIGDYNTFVNLAGWDLIAISASAVYSAYKWYRWSRKFPYKTLRYMFRSKFTVALVSIPLAGLAVYRLVAGPHAPALPYGGPILIVCLLTLIGNASITTFQFRDLDEEEDYSETKVE